MRRSVGVGGAAERHATARVTQLAGVSHRGLATPTGVTVSPDGEVIVTSPRMDGLDLAATVRAGGRLTAGQAVWLGTALLDALAALHQRGLAHGDVSPSNVVISRAGPVLVDLVGGPEERGTPGFAAPERAVAATPAADVFSVGKVLQAVVDDAGRLRVEAWTAPMIAASAVARPDAGVAARALASCAEPVALPPLELDVAGELRARAGSLAHEESTVKDPAAWEWRARRAARRGLLALGAALALSAVAWVAAGAWAALNAPAQPAGSPPLPVDVRVLPVPLDEVSRTLVESRFAALAAGDGDALAATTVAGSPAREDDAALTQQLNRGKARFDGIGVEVAAVEVLSLAGERATVLVTYDTPAYTQWRRGTATPFDAATHEVEVDLLRTDSGWLIERLRLDP